jgi:uncharacterized protein involved in response to NO
MSRLWSTYTAAPHRVMFLPGALQGVLTMLWWLFDLESRRVGGGGLGSLPGPAVHVWLMLYGFFPFFVFGFLFTAVPSWLNGRAIPRHVYVASGMLMTLGLALVYAGLAPLGLALHLAGWSVAVWALFRTLSGAPPQDKLHAGIVTLAAALGGVGDALFLAWAGADFPDALRIAEAIGLWGFLVPTFLTVCHRMIPWFTSRIVPNYVMVRPYGPLWGLLAGCLAQGALEAMERRELLWLVDLPMALVVFWFASRWGVARGVRQVRLLAMLHIAFLWAGLSLLLYAIDSAARYAGLDWNAGHAPQHALGIGFFSSMLLGMASRVSLGHSGRKLEADGLTWGLFCLVQGVALLRMLPDLLAGLPPGLPPLLITLAGGLWLLAFALWAGKYAPLYWRPRVDGKPG